MSVHVASESSSRAFHQEVLANLMRAGVSFLVGGGVAMARYAGVRRRVDDLELFMPRDEWSRAAMALHHAGIDTHVEYSGWLARACAGDRTVDIMYNGGNGLRPVDARWFKRAPFDDVNGIAVRLCPPEELIWSKAFLMERTRFGGADVLHLIRSCHDGLDWERLLELFERHPRVLLAHLVLFEFVYPGRIDSVPPRVLAHLWSRIGERSQPRHGMARWTHSVVQRPW